MIFKGNNYRPMGLTDKFTGGKHKGETLQDVITSDKTYIQWALQRLPDFTINGPARVFWEKPASVAAPVAPAAQPFVTIVERRKRYLQNKK